MAVAMLGLGTLLGYVAAGGGLSLSVAAGDSPLAQGGGDTAKDCCALPGGNNFHRSFFNPQTRTHCY